MKNKFLIMGGFLVLSGSAFAQFFADQDVMVVTATVANIGPRTANGNIFSVRRFDTSSNSFALSNAVVIPSMVISGVATTEGGLLYDPTSNRLTVAGYTNTVSGGVSSSTSASNPRKVAIIAPDGNTTYATSSTLYSGGSIRSAVVYNGGILTAGNNPGSVYGPIASGTFGASSVQVGGANTRFALVGPGNLVYSSSASDITVTPLTGGTPTSIFNSRPANWGVNGFKFNWDYSVLYAASDASTSGIIKFTRNANGKYDFAYRITVPTASGGGLTGARHLGIRNDGTIFITTSEDTDTSGNRLMSFVDSGTVSGSGLSAVLSTPFTLRATSGANEVFRGVEVVPEPASMAMIAVGLFGLAAKRRRK